MTLIDADAPILSNHTYDELRAGDAASLTRTIDERDIAEFALVSGDVNPAHLDEEYAAGTRFRGLIAHGMLGASLISAVLGTQLPGPGTVYLSQSLSFRAPVHPGDTLTATVTVSELCGRGRVTLECEVRDQDGVVVIAGEAAVLAPDVPVRRRAVDPRDVL